jgi:hypothetical protein
MFGHIGHEREGERGRERESQRVTVARQQGGNLLYRLVHEGIGQFGHDNYDLLCGLGFATIEMIMTGS